METIKFKIGTPVLFIPNKSQKEFGLYSAIGVIIDTRYDSLYEYQILFAEDDDIDWYTNENHNVAQMVENYKNMLSEA